MFDQDQIVTKILIGRILADYWNATQDALSDFMTGHIEADELQEVISELDEYYTNKIIIEMEKK